MCQLREGAARAIVAGMERTFRARHRRAAALGILLAAVAAAAPAPGCGSAEGGDGGPPTRTAAPAAPEGEEAKHRVIAKGSQHPAQEPQRAVIRDDRGWVEYWTKQQEWSKEPARTGEPDFSKEIAVVLSTGKKPTGGFRVEVARVLRRGDDLRVEVRVAPPKPDAIVTQAITHAYVVIGVPRVPGNVEVVDAPPAK
jgi:hypothetical protein